MGTADDSLRDFINGIPDSKLQYFSPSDTTIYSNTNFRLDMQGITSGSPRCYNLQIQVNYATKITTLKKAAPQTVAGPVFVEVNTTGVPAEIRRRFLDMMLI
ncbi:hypothetical protein F4859DRAFT_523957 [Xylaria cf. heliscus]|nr:hypothetical protein F4859DRAFT_523957 [Xylaria cf. heliscus]